MNEKEKELTLEEYNELSDNFEKSLLGISHFINWLRSAGQERQLLRILAYQKDLYELSEKLNICCVEDIDKALDDLKNGIDFLFKERKKIEDKL